LFLKIKAADIPAKELGHAERGEAAEDERWHIRKAKCGFL
jgi:hypothetical protein